jgi:hypothetical protein
MIVPTTVYIYFEIIVISSCVVTQLFSLVDVQLNYKSLRKFHRLVVSGRLRVIAMDGLIPPTQTFQVSPTSLYVFLDHISLCKNLN